MTINVIASGSKGNCYLIKDGDSSLLLDAGIPIAEIRKGCGFGLSEIDGALISHRHNDHAKAVPELIRGGIDVYAGADVFEAKDITSHRAKILTAGQQIAIGRWRVYPFSVHHDVPNFGFLIQSAASGEKLLYVTDTYYIEQRFSGLNYILCEANYDTDVLNRNIAAGYIGTAFKKRLVQSHMSIDTLAEMLKSNDLSHVRQIYLLHLSDANSEAQTFKERVQAITGCEVYVA